MHDINSLCMSTSLWNWAKTVSVHEGVQELKKELVLDSSKFGMEGVTIAQLQTNSNTHKPRGQVKPRQSDPFSTKESVGPSWQACVLKNEKSSRERHISNVVEEFRTRIKEWELDQDDRLIIADVNDVFVIGDHWYLAKTAASILEAKDRILIQNVILFLRRNQFVSTLSASG